MKPVGRLFLSIHIIDHPIPYRPPACGVLMLPQETDCKLNHRRDSLGEFGSVLIAFSGGVDGAFLARAAFDVLGGRDDSFDFLPRNGERRCRPNDSP